MGLNKDEMKKKLMKMWTEIEPAKKAELESQYARRLKIFENYLQQTKSLADKTYQVKPEKSQSVTETFMFTDNCKLDQKSQVNTNKVNKNEVFKNEVIKNEVNKNVQVTSANKKKGKSCVHLSLYLFICFYNYANGRGAT